MLGHYLQSALLNLRASPYTSAAKIVTLALGLAAMIAAVGVVAYWRSTDAHITDKGRAVVITSKATIGNNLRTETSPRSQAPLARYVRLDIPELPKVARFWGQGELIFDSGDHKAVLSIAYAEPELLDIFHFPFREGNPRTALQQKDGVILTEDAARRLFGKSPALGRGLVLTGQGRFVVTGVLGAIPEPSQFTSGDFKFDALTPMPPDPPELARWTGIAVITYALLPADGSMSLADLNRRLGQILDRRVPPADKTFIKVTPGALPVFRTADLQANRLVFGPSAGSNISIATSFLALGLLVLAVACLNYANLATAQAVARTREIGMRRTLGAGPFGILLQSGIEAGMSALMALALAVALLAIAAPVIKTGTGVDLLGGLAASPQTLAAVAAIVVGVVLACGVYPALIVSRVRPADALRAGKINGGSQAVGWLLIAGQFASASFLLIVVLVIGQQNAHVRQLALGRGGDPVVVLPTPLRSGVTTAILRQQLSTYPQIKAVGEAMYAPWTEANRYGLARNAGQMTLFGTQIPVGFGYFETYGQPVLAGRVFSPDRDADGDETLEEQTAHSTAPEPVPPVVVDQRLAERLGFASPQAALGQTVYADVQPYQIIGVVAPMSHVIQTKEPDGTLYGLRANRPGNTPVVRIAATDVDGGLTALRKVWKNLAAPDAPGPRFENELFEENFNTFTQIGRLFTALSLTALAISAAGLFGMAVHATQRRLHEIGVRKTLGSTTREVAALLLLDFSKPIAVANLIAWPVAYLAAQAYLSSFAERITVTPLPFVASLVLTLIISVLAVGGQTLRAASIRPAQVLRSA